MLFGRLFGRLASETEEDRQRRRAGRLAQAALRLYGLRDAEVELLRHEFVQVFRVRSASQGEFALRLYGLPKAIRNPNQKPPVADPGSLTAAALRSPRVLHSQLLWLSALRDDTGLRVPEPLRTLDGELVGQVTVEGTPWRRHSALVRWVPGAHKSDTLTETELLQAGSLLARMHDHAEGYVVLEGSEFPHWDWHWAFGETALLWNKGPEFYSKEEMEIFCQAALRIHGRLDELGKGRDVFGLIHRDLNPRNVVFSSEGVGVIDFDLSGFGYYVFDLSVFHRSLNMLPADRQQSLWKAFVRGYENVRPLPERSRLRLGRYLETFHALHRTAAINRRLELLSSDTAKPEAQEASINVLRASHRWLRGRVQHLAMLPCTLHTLPPALCELVVV